MQQELFSKACDLLPPSDVSGLNLENAKLNLENNKHSLENQNLPPMLRHYLEVKKQYPEHLLLFQVGDFFEVFFEDAKTVSDCLSIRLTSRDKDKEDPIPMCGVPIHAIDAYIPKLIAAGFSCAFVEQVEDAALSKGPVKRELTRVVTPSVRLDNEGLSETQLTYVSAFSFDEELRIAEVSFFDASVGKLKIYKISTSKELETLIYQYAPLEVVYNSLSLSGEKGGSINEEVFNSVLEEYSNYSKARLINYNCEPADLSSFEKIFFSPDLKANLELELGSKVSNSILYLFTYLNSLALSSSIFISSIQTTDTSLKTLVLDSSTIKNLELVESSSGADRKGSLQSVLDKTKTAQGSRLLTEWLLSPLVDKDEIESRLDFLSEIVKSESNLSAIRELLSETRDIERLSVRISNGRISPYEVGQLRDTLNFLPRLLELCSEFKSTFITELRNNLDIMSDISNILQSSLNETLPTKLGEGQLFKTGYNQQLDRYALLSTDSKTLITSLEIKEREESGISSLKIKYNSVFGYFIEIPKGQADKAPIRYSRRQTLTNVERFITEDLSKIEKEVLSAQVKYSELERSLYSELKQELSNHLARFKKISTFLSHLDVMCSLSLVALNSDFVRPEINYDNKTIIKNGRHPVVEVLAGRSDFVPNDTVLGGDGRLFAVLTGPNMGGKSTYLRQVGIIQILAQIGSFVPATSATIGIADRVFTRIGANDALVRGDSTFMVEMKEAALILTSGTSKSLVLIDEVGRGTSTTDGLALALGIAEHLIQNNKCRTIFATHYHECTTLPDLFSDSFCISVGLVNTSSGVVFTHRIEEKIGSGSYGLVVAKLAGLPESVILRAKELVDIELTNYNIKNNIVSNMDTTPDDKDLNLSQKGSEEVEAFKNILSLISVTDINSLKPLEALNKLNYFVELAKEVSAK